MLLKKFYSKYYKEKFFNRLFLIYTVIIILILIILAQIILVNLRISTEKEAIYYSSQILQESNNYFQQRNQNVKDIIQQLYLNKNLSPAFFNLIQKNSDKLTEEYYAQRQITDSFFNAALLSDKNILNIQIFSTHSDLTLNYVSIKQQNYSPPPPSLITALQSIIDENFHGVRTFNLKLNNYERNSFYIASNIFSKDFSTNLGIMVVEFNADSIDQIVANKDRFKNDIFVFSNNGESIYQTMRQQDNEPSLNYNLLKEQVNFNFTYENNLVSINDIVDMELMLVSTISKSELEANTLQFRQTIYFLLILFIILASISSYSVIYVFSIRIKRVNTALSKVTSGDLTARIKISNRDNDEISRISHDFNTMCDNLNAYIERVYFSDLKEKELILMQKDAELKQRTAEFYALQAQINPHFLFNTLESIRMRAIIDGNTLVGKMIRILATLFRNSIKDEMIVKIQDEINYCKLYSELHTLKSEDNIEIIFDINSEIIGFGIPKHIIQPMIENSINHGIDFNKDNNQITITGRRQDNEIHIIIADNGKGMDEKKLKELQSQLNSSTIRNNHNLGVANVDQRIKIIFGSQYGITIDSHQEMGTSIRIKIPAKTVEELIPYVQSTFS